jgi:hypothetical protein
MRYKRREIERPGYALHGIYNAETRRNAWTARDGEKIRAALNRRFGAELVRFGPHDIWALRLTQEVAGALREPQPPVIFFLPNGSTSARHDAASMARYYRHLQIDWEALYPSASSSTEVQGNP